MSNQQQQQLPMGKVQQQMIQQRMQRMIQQQHQIPANKLGVSSNHLSGVNMSDYCECGKLKKDCSHPNCSEDKPKVCPACNQEPCTCVSECESCSG